MERFLRYLAITLSAIVALGFVLFALDDIGRASEQEQARIANSPSFTVADPTPAGERAREQRNSKTREYIDDANDVLLKPFASVAASSNSRWMQRGVPAGIGLLLYGFGIGFLARYAKARGSSFSSGTRRPQSLGGST